MPQPEHYFHIGVDNLNETVQNNRLWEPITERVNATFRGGRSCGRMHCLCGYSVSYTGSVTESTDTNNNNNLVKFFIYLRAYGTPQCPVVK